MPRAIVLAAAATVLGPCATPAQGGAVGARAPEPAGSTFRASGPAAVVYGGPAAATRPKRPNDAFAGDVAAAVREGASAARRPPPRADVQLDAVAADVARFGRKPGHALVLHLMSHHGLVDPEPWLLMFAASPGAERELLADVREGARRAVANRPAARFGVGVARTDEGVFVAVALSEPGVELGPVPRALPSGGRAPLEGKLPPGFGQPQVVVTPPSGPVQELRVPHQGRSFSATMRCSAVDGPHQVEVAATGAAGPYVLANFPVYCGVAPPTDVRVHAETAPEGPVDPSTAARALLELANRERARVGTRALAWDAELARVARAYADELAARGTVEHVSARSGSLADRLRAAGLAPAVAGENLGMAGSVDDVHDGLMGSPGHRGVILDRRFARAGVGVAVRSDPNGAPLLFAVEVFAGN